MGNLELALEHLHAQGYFFLSLLTNKGRVRYLQLCERAEAFMRVDSKERAIWIVEAMLDEQNKSEQGHKDR